MACLFMGSGIFVTTMRRWSGIYRSHVAYHGRKADAARADREDRLSSIRVTKAKAEALKSIDFKGNRVKSWDGGERWKSKEDIIWALEDSTYNDRQMTRPQGYCDKVVDYHEKLKAKYQRAARY